MTLIIIGGLRMPEDLIKALAMDADGIALANSAIQAVYCVAARICHTNNCPSGVATQKPELRSRPKVNEGAQRLAAFLETSTKLMQVMARACGHDELAKFRQSNLTTWKRETALLAGVAFGAEPEKSQSATLPKPVSEIRCPPRRPRRGIDRPEALRNRAS